MKCKTKMKQNRSTVNIPLWIVLKLFFLLTFAHSVLMFNTEICDKFPGNNNCTLPKCFCNATSIPGNIPPEMTPQIIVFTYTGPVTEKIRKSLRSVFSLNYRNPNGCPIGITVFASNLTTDYCSVHRMYIRGHEIATSGLNGTIPDGLSKVDWRERFLKHKNMLIEKGHVPDDHVVGARAPALRLGGEKQYVAIMDGEFTYDSSIMVSQEVHGVIWPFTLDIKLEDLLGPCAQTECPRNVYPGLWEVPTVAIRKNKRLCHTLDECVHSAASVREVSAMLHANLANHRHNRAPMIINLNPQLLGKENAKEGLRIFIEQLLYSDPHVWFVPIAEMLDWVRTPVPLPQLYRFEPWDCPERVFYTGCETPCSRNKSDAGRAARPFQFIFPVNDLWWYQIIFFVVAYLFILLYDRQNKK